RAAGQQRTDSQLAKKENLSTMEEDIEILRQILSRKLERIAHAAGWQSVNPSLSSGLMANPLIYVGSTAAPSLGGLNLGSSTGIDPTTSFLGGTLNNGATWQYPQSIALGSSNWG